MDAPDSQARQQPKYRVMATAGEASEFEMTDMSSTWMQMPEPVNKSHQMNYDDRGMPTLNGLSSRSPLLDAHEIPSSRRFVRPQRRYFWNNQSILTDWWFWELMNWVIGTLCMMSIVIVLRRFDGQLLPKWRFGITINTLISTFAAVARACLLVPIAQGLSQLKWSWISRKDRNLADFEDFDMASRGWYGSMVMLFTRRYWSLPALPIIGAILMVLSLAVEPVTQQSVSYPVRLMIDNSGNAQATSLRSTSFFAFEQGPGLIGGAGDPQDVDSSTQASIFSGILNGNSSIPVLAPTCSSGNCTWTPYMTLGVCASIADVTSNLTGNCVGSDGTPTCFYNLGGGLVQFNDYESIAFYTFTTNEVVDGDTPPNYNGTARNIRSVAFQGAKFPVVDFFVLFTPQSPGTNTQGPIAAEIMLQFCVQTLNTTVRRGLAASTVTNWFTDFTLDGAVFSGTDGGNITATPPHEDSYHVGGPSFFVLNANLRSMFTANWSVAPDGGNNGFPNSGMQGLFTAASSFPYDIKGLQIMAGNLATSLSNNIRLRNSTPPAVGIAQTEVTYVKVDWNWIALISILVLASIGFMSLVIVDNSSLDNLLWKSSTLASLKALDSSAASATKMGLSTNWEMDKMAKITPVRLRKGARGWMIYSQ